MEVFVEHTGGRDNPEALERVEKLCAAAVAAVEGGEARAGIRGGGGVPEALERVEKLGAAAVAAIENVEARVAIRGVASYSKLLFSDDGPLGLERGPLSTLAPLRLRIRQLLRALRPRLGAIEAERLRRQELELELRRRRQM